MLTAKELPELRIEDYPEREYLPHEFEKWEKFGGGVRYLQLEVEVDGIPSSYAESVQAVRPMISTLDLRYSGGDYHHMVESCVVCQTCWFEDGDLIFSCTTSNHQSFTHQDTYI